MKCRLNTLCCVLFLLVMFGSLPLVAQKNGGVTGGTGGKGGGSPVGSGAGPVGGAGPGFGGNPTTSPYPFGFCSGTTACPTTTPRPMPATPTQDDDTCFLPPVDGIQSPTVSVVRLEVPGKARHEYEKACSEVHHKKYPQAEEHLQKAISNYSAYTGAWVLLGQVQQLENKKNDATESCSRAERIDSNYAPSYLCLAHLAAGEKNWNQLKELTNHLLQLHPLNASNAYYYNALAYFHLNNLSSAEVSARRGVQDTEKNHQPQLHRLLAQIYEKKGDRTSEITQLHEYLKRAPHATDAAEVNSLIQSIDKRAAAGHP